YYSSSYIVIVVCGCDCDISHMRNFTVLSSDCLLCLLVFIYFYYFVVFFLFLFTIFFFFFFFFQAEDGIRDATVTGVQTCALPISTPGSPLICSTCMISSAASSFLRAPTRKRATFSAP